MEHREKDLKRAERLFQKIKPNIELEIFDEPTVEALKKSMELFEKWEEKERVAETYTYWGRYLSEKEDFKTVEGFYQKSLYIRLALFGETHRSIVEVHLLLGHYHKSVHDFQNAQAAFDKALEVTSNLFDKPHLMFAKCYDGISSVFFEQNQFKHSLEYAKKAWEIVQSLPTTPPLFLGKLYILLSSVYHSFGNYEKTKYFIEKGMILFETVLPSTHKQLGANYYNLSYFYDGLGDYPLALLYMKKALTLFEYHQPNGMYNAWAYHSLQTIYNSQHKYKESIQAGKKALEILKKKGDIKSSLKVIIYKYLGVSYANLKQSSEALEYLQQALESAIEVFGSESMPVAALQHTLGRCYIISESYNQAEIHFRESLSILEKLPNVHLNHYLNVWGGLGISLGHSKTPDYSLALHFAHKVLVNSLEGFSNEDLYAYPLTHALQKNTYFVDPIHNIISKATTFLKLYQHDTKSIKDLKAAFQGFEVAIQLANHTRQSFQSDSSKLWLAKIMQGTMIEGFKVSQMLYEITYNTNYLQSCFRLSEQDKAYLLLLANQEKNAQQNTRIPASLLEKESELKSQLTLLQKSIQAQEQKNNTTDTKLIETYQNDYIAVHQAFEKLRKQLKEEYPDYYRKKYSTENVSIETLQQSLQTHQTVLSYFIGKEKVYLFVITHEECELFVQAKPSNWTDLIQYYLQSIKLHQKAKYIQLSFELYQILLQEAMHHVIDSFGTRPKQVFVVPHAELHYLPFETLLIQEAQISTSYQNLNYLLNHCEISYHYSATLLHLDLQKQAQITAQQAPTEMTFTGFAPVYEFSSNAQKEALKTLQADYATAVNRSEAIRSDGTWVPLPHSKIEVESISQLFEQQGFKSQSFLYETASKRNLEEQIGNSRFVLIAAHGIVNDEYPELSGLVLASDGERQTVDEVENSLSFEKHGDIWNSDDERNADSIAVEDCILNMREVSMIPMKADLVVLSSCESGIGELHKGEGMMAVNRGFLASGAKNVVSTLFKVNDRASSELTQLLFAYILKGENYGTALQKAKLQLLHKEEMGPKIWSGFVLFGTGM